MTVQINLRLPENLRKLAQKRVKERGYRNIQELAMEALREKVVEYDDEFSPKEVALLEKFAELTIRHEDTLPIEKLRRKLRSRR